jgi:hypothetical protein
MTIVDATALLNPMNNMPIINAGISRNVPRNEKWEHYQGVDECYGAVVLMAYE